MRTTSSCEPRTVKLRLRGVYWNRGNSSEVVRAAVLAGQGLGLSTTFLFEEEMARGEAQLLLADWAVQELLLHLVSPLQRRHSAKVRALGDLVAAAGL
ncbi:LysR substrate-binding domain-containing protein [Hylemonella gracilis]|uniref:LysR substrate-binding domain-containing protein n=1 Tax=Hylemonella gracilis TaxID=80880 RepID=UPI003D6DF05D